MEEKKWLFRAAEPRTLNVPTRVMGEPVVFTRNGEKERIPEDAYLRYGSYLQYREGEWGIWQYYRPATDEELKEILKYDIERKDRKARERWIDEVKRRFRNDGEKPEGQISLDGDKLIDKHNAFGGGDWFVVTEDHIWYVENNGSDGADWSQNNIKTGGAGAIGYRMAYDENLVIQLRAFDASAR